MLALCLDGLAYVVNPTVSYTFIVQSWRHSRGRNKFSSWKFFFKWFRRPMLTNLPAVWGYLAQHRNGKPNYSSNWNWFCWWTWGSRSVRHQSLWRYKKMESNEERWEKGLFFLYPCWWFIRKALSRGTILGRLVPILCLISIESAVQIYEYTRGVSLAHPLCP